MWQNHKTTPLYLVFNVRKSHQMTHLKANAKGLLPSQAFSDVADSQVLMPSVKTHWPVWDICALMHDFETNIYASNFWYTRVFLPTVQALISRGWGWGPCLQKLHCLITQMVVEVVHLQWVISQMIPLFWVTPMNCFSGYIDLQCGKKGDPKLFWSSVLSLTCTRAFYGSLWFWCCKCPSSKRTSLPSCCKKRQLKLT